MELFETIGWRDKAASIGLKAAELYGKNRLKYGYQLRNLTLKFKSMTSDTRYEKVISGLGHKLGDIVGGKKRNPNE